VRVSGNGFGYRLRKFVGRNRVAAALAALTLPRSAAAWQRRSGRCVKRSAARRRVAAARRSDAVRTYLMLMFRDAAGQKDATKVNVRGVFKSGTARLFDEFRDDPAAGQTTALMLSDLYLQLGDVKGADRCWKGNGRASKRTRTQANARYNLAQIEVVRGATAHARELLEQAQPGDGRPGAARAILNEAPGEDERASTWRSRRCTMRIAERRALIGHDDFEVGNLLHAEQCADASRPVRGSRSEIERKLRRIPTVGQADTDGGMAALNRPRQRGVDDGPQRAGATRLSARRRHDARSTARRRSSLRP
jgi:serine/threonine-protein kinase